MNETVRARPFTIDELRAYLVEVFPEFWETGDLRLEESADERHAPPHLSPQAPAARRHDLGANDVRRLRRRALCRRS